MKWFSKTSKTIGLKNKVSILMLTCMTASTGFSQASIDYHSVPASDYWKQSSVPLLGQLVPVNQINLQKGVHLFDVETIGKKFAKVVDTVEPDPELVAKYEERYQKFRTLYPAMKPLF